MQHKQLKICVLFIIQMFLSVNSFAQKDSVVATKPVVELSGFVDIFYSYDFNKPKTNYRQNFLYNHNRHNEFNLNLGYLKLAVNHAKYRANFALHGGTYSNDNYASEPQTFQNIFEANAGISLNTKNSLWLDAGIFASHIGFETAVSIDNWTLTRSLLAENSPYYLSGAKLTFTPNKQWEIAALICNGWQRIQRVQENSLPSFGTQIKFSPTEKAMFNWSTFIGTDDPDSTRRMRFFNNFFGQFQINKKVSLIAGFDIGIQQQTKNSSQHEAWFSPVMIAKYAIAKKWATAFRAEYYQDKTGVLIATKTPNGFNTTGFSLNFDYLPTSTIACRIESRWLNSKDKIFERGNVLTNNNFLITSSLVVKIN
ncbi:MAG: porin [Chitinophagaceae bacterium]|nr:porin [Chitinophagaceae bacterium]